MTPMTDMLEKAFSKIPNNTGVYAGARTTLTRTFDRTLPDLEPHSAGVKPHLSGSLPERTSDRPAHMDSFIRICG